MSAETEPTRRVSLDYDEKYPWLAISEPGKWNGTNLDRPWVELPVAVIERYVAACDAWEGAFEALEQALHDAPEGGVPAMVAHIAKDPEAHFQQQTDREARDLDPKDRPRVVAELVRRHKEGETPTLQSVLIHLGIAKGPGPEWDDRG